MIKQIETERLVIREVKSSDAPSILKLFNQEDCLKYIGDKGIRTIEDAENYITSGPIKSYQEHGLGLLAVSKDDKFIGLCGLLKREEFESPDLGFAFLQPFYGKGYAFEASKGVLLQNKNMHKIIALTHLENTASISLLKKLGFNHRGTIAFGENKEPSHYFELIN